MQDAKLTPIPLTYLGSAFFISWTFFVVINSGEAFGAFTYANPLQFTYGTSAICMVVVITALSVFPNRYRVPLLTSTGAKVTIGLGLTLSTFGLFGIGDVATIASIGTGLFSGALATQWVYIFRAVGLRQAVRCFPLLLATSVCLCTTLTWLPQRVIEFLVILLPAASEALYHLSRKSPLPQFEFSRLKSERISNYLVVLAVSAIFAIVIGFFDHGDGVVNYAPLFYGCVSIAALFAAGIYLHATSASSFSYDFGGPLVLIAVALTPFLSTGDVQTQTLMLGNITAEVLIFILAVGVAEYLDIDPLKSYAIIRVVMTIVGMLSTLLTSYLSEHYENTLVEAQTSAVFVSIGAIAIVALFATVAATTRTLPGEPVTDVSSDAAELKHLGSSVAAFDSQCETIAAETGLSQREADVFKLLARGYTSSRIQKKLYIAAGTVSYHSHNIYSKLGVHSKQELIDLIQSTL